MEGRSERRMDELFLEYQPEPYLNVAQYHNLAKTAKCQELAEFPRTAQ